MTIGDWVNYFARYKLKGFYALFFNVSWAQDTELKNDGFDLIVPKGQGYFRGTFFQLMKNTP